MRAAGSSSAPVSSAPHATRTVTNALDSGAGSLRDALAAAGVGDTIQFSLTANSVITVASELDVATALTLDGSTATNLKVSGGNTTRVFNVTAPATLQDFAILNGNSAGDGGGVYSTGSLTLTRMTFLSNTASSFIFCSGGCILVLGNGGGVKTTGTLIMTGTQFISNTATGSGGGLNAGGALIMTGTQFISNTANVGGGASVVGAATLTYGLFQNNKAISTSGGGLFAQNMLALTGTRFISNTADVGGGIFHTSGTGLSGRIVNALFSRNSATTNGADIYLSNVKDQILHSTLANPTVGGEAIYVTGGATSGITDTIVASHTVGIHNTGSGGEVFQDYNLLFGNTTNASGVISGGTHNITGTNPSFVNPSLDNYRLNSNSPAIDTGTNVGVTTDIDGQTRPIGIGFDIGYYEYAVIRKLFLPLILR